MTRGPSAVIACLAAAGLLAAPPAPARAQAASSEAVAGFESAGELLRKCRERSTFARSHCFAYLAAVADAARSYRVWIGAGDPCLPPQLTLGRLADIYDAYLVANPSLTRAQAASVVVASLQEAFPCAPAPAPAPAPAQEPAAPWIAPPPDPGAPPPPDPRSLSGQPAPDQVDAAPQGRGQP